VKRLEGADDASKQKAGRQAKSVARDWGREGKNGRSEEEEGKKKEGRELYIPHYHDLENHLSLGILVQLHLLPCKLMDF
jgi:hypothetical protein